MLEKEATRGDKRKRETEYGSTVHKHVRCAFEIFSFTNINIKCGNKRRYDIMCVMDGQNGVLLRPAMLVLQSKSVRGDGTR